MALWAPVPCYLALCAYDEGPWRPIAVRVADEVVGLVMWGVDSTDGGCWIGGLIIGRRHQRRGYGRAAVLELLERAALAGHREAASLRAFFHGCATCHTPRTALPRLRPRPRATPSCSQLDRRYGGTGRQACQRVTPPCPCPMGPPGGPIGLVDQRHLIAAGRSLRREGAA